MKTTTLDTFIVGAGPVATALAGALRAGGVPVLGLWARRPAAARQASAIAGVASFSAAPPDLLLEADVVVLAVRDDAIAEVASMLLATGLITGRHVMLHCSGARSARDVLGHVSGHIGGVGTLHPLMALADGRSGIEALPRALFGVEGDRRGEAMAHALARAMGARSLVLSGQQMAAYHAAASMASNHLVALIDAAASLLTQLGLSDSDAVAALVPLARGSLDNVAARGPVLGLTGPIKRGDSDTVRRHLDHLPDDVRAVYHVLGTRTVELARRAGGASDAALEVIERLLSHPDRAQS